MDQVLVTDRQRVKMLNILLASEDEVCVCDFDELLGLKQSRRSGWRSASRRELGPEARPAGADSRS